jgi:hypothetical protein
MRYYRRSRDAREASRRDAKTQRSAQRRPKESEGAGFTPWRGRRATSAQRARREVTLVLFALRLSLRL